MVIYKEVTSQHNLRNNLCSQKQGSFQVSGSLIKHTHKYTCSVSSSNEHIAVRSKTKSSLSSCLGLHPSILGDDFTSLTARLIPCYTAATGSQTAQNLAAVPAESLQHREQPCPCSESPQGPQPPSSSHFRYYQCISGFGRSSAAASVRALTGCRFWSVKHEGTPPPKGRRRENTSFFPKSPPFSDFPHPSNLQTSFHPPSRCLQLPKRGHTPETSSLTQFLSYPRDSQGCSADPQHPIPPASLHRPCRLIFKRYL